MCKARDNYNKPHYPCFNVIGGERVLCCSRCGRVLEMGDKIIVKPYRERWFGVYGVTDEGEPK
ncbi:hypothetical protein LCGC14_2934380 [marine sediment metagenome]|uniref:Uncharacterized protein n=1 Tax=marine sediment metagenome TaxID=412755 RepID=A0A0F8XJW8_9ZZZZ